MLLAFAALLAGCASRDPLAYLPQSSVYASFNFDELRTQQGTTRILEKFRESAQTPAFDKISRCYVIVSRLGPAPSMMITPEARVPLFYGIVTGKPGVTQDWLGYAKQNGGENVQVFGRKCLRFGGVVFLPLSDSAFGFAPGEEGVARMIRVAHKKEPAATASQEFAMLRDSESTQGLTIVARTSRLVEQYSAQIAIVGMLNAQAAQAIRQVQFAKAAVNWEKVLTTDISLGLKDEAQAGALASFVRSGMNELLRTDPAASKFVDQIQTSTSGQNVVISASLPEDLSRQLQANLERAIAELPVKSGLRNSETLTTTATQSPSP